MKRSKMLRLLEKDIKFCKYADEDLEPERLLATIENAGMLPPATDYFIKNQPDGFTQTWEEVNDYHNWEPEDEEE